MMIKGKNIIKDRWNKIRIPIGNQEIAAVILRSKKKGKSPLIIFLNGSGGVKERYESIQKYFSKKGYLSVAFDFRGRGESDGERLQNSLLDQMQDVKMVATYLIRNYEVDKDKITLFATSMGAFIASSVANQIKAKRLILSAPALFMPEDENKPQDEINTYARTIIPTLKNLYKQSRSIKEISKFSGNLLVIEHELDETIPKWLVKAHFNSARKAKVNNYEVLKTVKHPIMRREVWKKKLIKVIDLWLEKLNSSKN